jgi:putative FmdB family regulatory protein
MPVYDYKCRKCGKVFEKFLRTLAAADSVQCEKCGSGDVKKLVTCCAISSGGKSESSGGSTSSHSCGSCSGSHCSTCH